jgi:hypothetical protein
MLHVLIPDSSEDRNRNLEAFLLQFPGIYNNLLLTDLYIEMGRPVDAMQTYDQILRNNLDMPSQEYAEFTNARPMMQLLADMKAKGRNLKSITGDELSQILDVFDNTTMWAYDRAGNWVRLAMGEEYERRFLLPGDKSGIAARKITAAVSEQSGIDILSVYPNPANSSVTIEKKTTEAVTIRFTDISGRVLTTVTLGADQPNKTVDVSQWPVGVIFYRGISATKKTEGKLTILR